jgi:hypothetical protein
MTPMGKNVDYNVRIIMTPTGKLRLGFVHFLSETKIEKRGPFKDCKYRQWKNAPAKVRNQLAKAIGAKKLAVKKPKHFLVG